MQKKPILVVMAAGMGSRYGGLKQIDPVGNCGEAILDYSVFDAKRAGFETVVFIIKHEIEEAFKSTIGARLAPHIEVRYAYQQLENLPQGYTIPQGRTKPWGTSHAILSADAAIDAPFAVINADDYYGPEAFQLIYDYLSTHADDEVYEYSMVGYLLKNTVTENGYVSRGVCVTDDSGYLESVTERTRIETYAQGIHYSEDDGATWTDIAGESVVSMNLWGFTRSFVDEIAARFSAFLDKALVENPLKAEFYLPSVVSALISEEKARVKVLHSTDRWHGVTYKEDKPMVVAAIAEKTTAGLYPSPLWG